MLSIPLIQSYQPASFLERGVAVAFTTPQLAGARVRHADRTGTEFVVPNPAGGRGVYVLHWGGVRQLCRPTVHDTLLHQRISRLPIMDPRGVRMVTRQLAAEGMAGKDAAAAAIATQAADLKDLILVNFLLLMTLMEQVEPSGLPVSAGTERTPELDRRARRIVTLVGGRIGRGTGQIGADLEALAGLFLGIGLDADAPPARLPRLIQRLCAAADSLNAWARRFPEDNFAPLAASLARSAQAATLRTTATLRAARELTQDMPGLLRQWASAPADTAMRLSRPEWVLDGWERFCVLWETATQISGQRAVLAEIAQLVPALPRELAGWGAPPMDPDPRERIFQDSRLNDTWRGGSASFGLIARNERLQALIL